MVVEVAPTLSTATSPPDAASDRSIAEANQSAPTQGHTPGEDPVPQPGPDLSPQGDVDFLLHPTELAKGQRAAENYLSSFRSEDSRRMAEEALETLATVISGGKCDSVAFPWQQVQPYHGAAALTILKEKGAPARVEALRCRRDTTRGYRIVPDSYPTRQVQKIRSTLSKVIQECGDLGYVAEAKEADSTSRTKAATKKSKTVASGRKTAAAQGRVLGDGEIRALVAASLASGDAAGLRDAVLFSLIYRGFKIAQITALTPDSVKFSGKTGACSVIARPTGGGAGRRVELSNEELICLEDWLDHRGNQAGPLLCTLGRAGKVEGKRLTTALLKQICEDRAHGAQVREFTPNDLSRSAEALTLHRKAARRKAARLAQENLSSAEKALYMGATETDPDSLNETIQFPFLGLGV